MNKPSFAVLLNMNARHAGPAIVEQLRRIMPADDIYASDTEEAADQALAEIVARQYPLVFCGGGDGTAMHLMNRVAQCVRAQNETGAACRAPAFGFLKLGAGNGWAAQMNTPGGITPVEKVRDAAWSDLHFARCNLLEVDGRLFDRGGMGLDGLTINSFVALNRRFAGGPLAGFFRGLGGYWAALFFKTLPHILSKGLRTKVRVTNLSAAPLLRVDETGEAVATPIGQGGLIYEGSAIWVGFGTVRMGGYGFVMYPFALTRHGWMNLRIADFAIPTALWNVRAIYQGRYRGERFWDYLAREVLIEFDREMPFHLNGDAKGFRREFRVKVSEFEPEILDFRNR